VEYIEIDVEEIPFRCEIDLAGEIFTLEFHYNHDFDFFTVDIERDGNVLVYGEKLVIGRALFSSLTDSRLPKMQLIPKDLSGQASRVGWDELGTTVFLMVEPPGSESA